MRLNFVFESISIEVNLVGSLVQLHCHARVVFVTQLVTCFCELAQKLSLRVTALIFNCIEASLHFVQCLLLLLQLNLPFLLPLKLVEKVSYFDTLAPDIDPLLTSLDVNLVLCLLL